MLNPDQFHPHVDHYRDGGLGGVGEDHSVVGMVPTSVLKHYAEWDRTDEANHPGSREKIDALRRDLREGKGFHTPLMLLYDHQAHWAKLGEGNHRLAAALEEDVPEVPVRVVRSRVGPHDVEGTYWEKRGRMPGAPATDNWPRRGGWDYVPSDMHPSHINFDYDVRDLRTQ